MAIRNRVTIYTIPTLLLFVIGLVVFLIVYIKIGNTSISQKDIEDGQIIVKNYFAAIKANNIDGVNRTLGKYKNGMYNENNIKDWKQPQLLSVEYPGKFTSYNIPPSSYKSNYGKDPYKSMDLYVEFKEGTELKGWNYILVKESADSPWLIHDWGH